MNLNGMVLLYNVHQQVIGEIDFRMADNNNNIESMTIGIVGIAAVNGIYRARTRQRHHIITRSR